MAVEKKEIEHMLNLALATSLNHQKFYMDAAAEATDSHIKALLTVLGESEDEIAAEIERMRVMGVVGAVLESDTSSSDSPPDETPFDLQRAETDQRLFICNTALAMEIKGYTFYLSIAVRAKSELISRLFEYLARRKAAQISKIRRMCETF